MGITLYYIEGITPTDEPVFDSIDNQVKFFSNHVVSSIDSGFYPPHYQNEIKLQINDEIDITKSINYLSLEFVNKVYYYFIDSVEYVSEDVISLGITMDVIQTYMFDTQFINSQISRNSISRRTADGRINRNYIRENLSNGIMEAYAYKKLNDGNLDWLIVKFSDDINIYTYRYLEGNNEKTHYGDFFAKYYGNKHGTTDNAPVNNQIQVVWPYPPTNYTVGKCGIKKFIINNKVYNDGCTYMLVPIPRNNKNLTLVYDNIDYRQTITYEQLLIGIRELSTQPEVVDITYCPYDIFTQYSTDVVSNSVRLFLNRNQPVFFMIDKQGYDIHKLHYNYFLCPCLAGFNFTLTTMSDSTSSISDGIENVSKVGSATISSSDISIHEVTRILYEKDFLNGLETNSFSYTKIPQLIDENYFSLYFGEKSGYTSFPLEVLDGVHNLTLHYLFVPNTGTRVYYANDDYSYNDTYLTLIQDSTDESWLLFNDAWKQYISQNKATWTLGYKLASQKNLYSYASDIVSNINDNYNVYNRAISTYNQGKKVRLTNRRRGAIGGLIESTANAMMNQYAIDTERNTAYQNKIFTPDTVKQGNSYIADDLSDTTKWFYVIYMVSDIDDCAREFESKGFKVHQTLTGVNLFTYQHRYYYDVIKCDDLNITLSILNDDDTIQEIKDRFKNGLRLWHTDNGVLRQNLGNMFQYDNADVHSIQGE